MFNRTAVYRLLFLIFVLTAQNFFPHNLNSESLKDAVIQKNSNIHHSLVLDSESQFYHGEFSNSNENELQLNKTQLDTSNSWEEDSARRLLPEDMSWMEKFLWGKMEFCEAVN